ncbi:hypothetical protein H5410_052363 [Solanum commersonii]|uniref:Uncharacterized protein n=1 Tax=Solanum commersonii TaxID=4109 RepID=A0A9J5X3W2_SOLCO|nr:hypothetical protein H5410_052363 [Solanum commersonii]
MDLYASIKGWEYCMHVVVVDGSFLKASYRGTILTACTHDAAGKILSLAFDVVDTWKCFSKGSEIPMEQEKGCFIVYAYTTFGEEFNQYMAETYSIDKRVKEYLFEIGYHRWSIAHSNVNRFMVITSNIAESVNATDKETRDLLIYDLLDYLMKMIGRWNNTNRNEAIATGTTFITKYEHIMREKMKESQGMMVVPSTEYLYIVYDGVYPIPDESIWEIPPDVAANIVLPPKGKVKLGRPQKIRYKTVVNQDQRSQELHAECVDNKITIGRHAKTFHRQLSL